MIAQDVQGVLSSVIERTFTIVNETEPPMISLISPLPDGGVIEGNSLQIVADITGNKGIAFVELYVDEGTDEQRVATFNKHPWSYQYQAPMVTGDKPIDFRFRAQDVTGLEANVELTTPVGILSDAVYPFEFTFPAPAANGADLAFEISARATDQSGNISSSFTINLLSENIDDAIANVPIRLIPATSNYPSGASIAVDASFEQFFASDWTLRFAQIDWQRSNVKLVSDGAVLRSNLYGGMVDWQLPNVSVPMDAVIEATVTLKDGRQFINAIMIEIIPLSITLSADLPHSISESGTKKLMFDGVWNDAAEIVVKVNANEVGTVMSSPYVFDLKIDDFNAGESINITAELNDASGIDVMSNALDLNVVSDDTLPVITHVRFPVSAFEGERIEIEIEASDDVAISEMRLLIDGNAATLSQRPFITAYQLPLLSSISGTGSSISIVAVDDSGNQSAPFLATINILGDDSPQMPVIVEATSPVDGTSFIETSIITISGRTSDSDGIVSRIGVKINGETVASEAVTENVFSVDVKLPAVDGFTPSGIELIAHDQRGNTSSPFLININIVDDVEDPVIVELLNQFGLLAIAGTELRLTVPVTDNVGIDSLFVKAEFNNQVLSSELFSLAPGNETAHSFEKHIFLPETVIGGRVAITATATDFAGNTAQRVESLNVLPTYRATKPQRYTGIPGNLRGLTTFNGKLYGISDVTISSNRKSSYIVEANQSIDGSLDMINFIPTNSIATGIGVYANYLYAFTDDGNVSVFNLTGSATFMLEGIVS